MKTWQDEIVQHIATWSGRLGNRSWWPKNVYHFTDINNAASIIRSGKLVCRTSAVSEGRMVVDNASQKVIQQTNPAHFGFVRMYFRPRTPTQYHNEGIRPLSKRSLESHCPVPVFFCFDALGILAQDDTEFSDGNMGSGRVQYSKERDFFQGIPFHQVFHDGAFTPQEKAEIIFRRNAEVLVPNSLSLLPHLKFIVCRSTAERQTLLHLLPVRQAAKWAPIIRIDTQGLFERRWTFVEEVITVADSRVITFKFNPSSSTSGPFHIKFEYREAGDSAIRLWEGTRELGQSLQIKLADAISGEASLHLDGALAYQNTIYFEEIPF